MSKKSWYLTAAQMAKIRQLMPRYRWAAALVREQTPIMLAVLHVRESGLRDKAPMHKGKRIPGGPFQRDTGTMGQKLREQIKAHTAKVCRRYGLPYHPVDEDFDTALLVAADWFKERSRGGPLATRNRGDLERVGDGYWGYNGRSGWHTEDGTYSLEKRHWRYSAYVVNDPRRGVCLKIRGTMPDGHGGRMTINRISQRPGALVLYKELRQRIHELEA